MTTEPRPMGKVLVVDDDSSFVRTLEDILELRGYEVVTASEGRRALGMLLDQPDPPLVALIDIGLPDISGLDVARTLHERQSGTQVIILTGQASVESAISAVRADTVDYLVKPIQPPALLETIGRASERGLRRLVEMELERERKLKSDILEASPLGIAVLSPDGDARFLNRSAVETLGIEEGPEGHAGHPEVRQWLEACLARGAGAAAGEDYLYARPDGASVRLSTSATPLRDPTGSVDGVLVIFSDVTEQRRLEEDLRDARRMEAVGRLAGGVAHDFNNVLTVILAHADLLVTDLDASSPHREDAEAIREAAQQAADVAAQLLTFSRRSLTRHERVDLNGIIRALSGLLARTLGSSLHVRIDLQDALLSVKADPGQLRQVIMNLAINARDAVEGSGTLTFRTLMEPRPRVDSSRPSGVEPPGAWVVMEAEDDGSGMNAATRTRIFEPFFTTKPEGSGTGLGLSTVYGIVSQLGGQIEVTSHVGVGTTFRIRLPSA